MNLSLQTRSISSDDALQHVRPYLASAGITRLADLTGLDWLGIPVAASYRPGASTLSVSQGKGGSRSAALIGAAMEAVELSHAESFDNFDGSLSSAAENNLCYPIESLGFAERGLVSGRTPLRWADADLLQAVPARTVVPRALIGLTYELSLRRRTIGLVLFPTSSNGLASGLSYADACLHAIYEVVERDGLARAWAGDVRLVSRRAAASLCDDPVSGLLLNSDVDLELEQISNRWAIPTFRCYLWTRDFTVTCAGTGSHSDVGVAIARAVTEAAQTRITQIAGARDDIPSRQRRPNGVGGYSPARTSSIEPDRLPAPLGSSRKGHESAEKHLELLAAHVAGIAGYAPMVSVLSDGSAPWHVVKVLIPSTRFNIERSYATIQARPAGGDDL